MAQPGQGWAMALVLLPTCMRPWSPHGGRTHSALCAAALPGLHAVARVGAPWGSPHLRRAMLPQCSHDLALKVAQQRTRAGAAHAPLRCIPPQRRGSGAVPTMPAGPPQATCRQPASARRHQPAPRLSARARGRIEAELHSRRKLPRSSYEAHMHTGRRLSRSSQTRRGWGFSSSDRSRGPHVRP
jgi:hypothetical protein